MAGVGRGSRPRLLCRLLFPRPRQLRLTVSLAGQGESIARGLPYNKWPELCCVVLIYTLVPLGKPTMFERVDLSVFASEDEELQRHSCRIGASAHVCLCAFKGATRKIDGIRYNRLTQSDQFCMHM